MTSEAYWQQRYAEASDAHSVQNAQITASFLHAVRGRAMEKLLQRAGSIIELGCGTGEMSSALAKNFTAKVRGFDLSENAIAVARKKYSLCEFLVGDVLTMPEASADVVVASNVLEHFRDPHIVIASMMAIAQAAIVIVPYKQPSVDGYDAEGGAGHVFTFDEYSFRFPSRDWFSFSSPGWQHHSRGETPLQLAVWLSRP